METNFIKLLIFSLKYLMLICKSFTTTLFQHLNTKISYFHSMQNKNINRIIFINIYYFEINHLEMIRQINIESLIVLFGRKNYIFAVTITCDKHLN